MTYEGPLNKVNGLEALKKRVLEFKPREIVNFEGREYMIMGINTETGHFNLQEVGTPSRAPVGDVLENISPFKVEKIKEVEELPDSAVEDLEDENDLLAAK